MFKKKKINCDRCDFNWSVNKNEELKKGFCYMNIKKPKSCSFNTFEYDEKLKKKEVV